MRRNLPQPSAFFPSTPTRSHFCFPFPRRGSKHTHTVQQGAMLVGGAPHLLSARDRGKEREARERRKHHHKSKVLDAPPQLLLYAPRHDAGLATLCYAVRRHRDAIVEAGITMPFVPFQQQRPPHRNSPGVLHLFLLLVVVVHLRAAATRTTRWPNKRVTHSARRKVPILHAPRRQHTHTRTEIYHRERRLPAAGAALATLAASDFIATRTAHRMRGSRGARPPGSSRFLQPASLPSPFLFPSEK